jgi:hypothetical protein
MRLIKSLLIALTIGFTVFAVLFAVFPGQKKEDITVDTIRCFVTKHGTHFHSATCEYINNSDVIETTTYEAMEDGRYICNYCRKNLYKDPNTVKITINNEAGFTLNIPTISIISVAAGMLGFTVSFLILFFSQKTLRSKKSRDAET